MVAVVAAAALRPGVQCVGARVCSRDLVFSGRLGPRTSRARCPTEVCGVTTAPSSRGHIDAPRLAFVALAAVGALTYVRLYFGVDLTDESFYIGRPIPLRPRSAAADDETNIVPQTPAVLLYPFVQLWQSLIGLDGIILYARHLHLLFSGTVSLALFLSLRRILGDRPLSAVLAGSAIAFVPFGIHALSYNTFSSGFFAAGCFLGAGLALGRQPPQPRSCGDCTRAGDFRLPDLRDPGRLLLRGALSHVSPPLGAKPRTGSRYRLSPEPSRQSSSSCTTASDDPRAGRVNVDLGGQGGGLHEVGTILNLPLHELHAQVPRRLVARRRRRTSCLETGSSMLPLILLPIAALPADLGSSAAANQFVTNAGLLAPAVFLLCSRSAFSESGCSRSSGCLRQSQGSRQR